MKYCLLAFALAAQQSYSCESPDMGALRIEVEAAFEAKTFAGYAARHGVSGPVKLTLENEYDEDKPERLMEFEDILELSAWFHEMHEPASSMIVPENISCVRFSCLYELPKQTLHHGVYLTGFESEQIAGCLSLVRISIHWG